MPVTEAKRSRGRLRIGDDWNAITIIALSQNNPLKAVAEFVENSIDAGACSVTIVRGKERGQHYLKIIDDGKGIPLDETGIPDFRYVATHICDSLKRRLKAEGALGIQGEFGIGLLSFWTVGEGLSLMSSGSDGKAYEMTMQKGRPGYEIKRRSHLLPMKGTTLRIAPLLPGIRSLNGEKIQRYLASELRDRIRTSAVKIKVRDRLGRMECQVEPREFSGTLLHGLPQPSGGEFGDIYTELYLGEQNAENQVGLYRNGTRVLSNLAILDEFSGGVWSSGFLQGIVDCPFLTITPGTRDGIIRDEKFERFTRVMIPLQKGLDEKVREQQRAEEERASRNILKSVQTALREAILDLPPEEYDWFNIHQRKKTLAEGCAEDSSSAAGESVSDPALLEEDARESNGQKQFFQFAGPLFSARIYPANTLVSVSQTRLLRAAGMDKSRRLIDNGLKITWEIVEGHGHLDKHEGEMVMFTAPQEPVLVRIRAAVTQGEVCCEADSSVMVVDSLVEQPKKDILSGKGLPGYTMESARNSRWRSRYDEKNNLVVINSGHRDFVFASRNRARKIRYISRLFSKELVSKNFVGLSADDMMERLIELSLYTEERLR